jgi:hypothetical protein
MYLTPQRRRYHQRLKRPPYQQHRRRRRRRHTIHLLGQYHQQNLAPQYPNLARLKHTLRCRRLTRRYLLEF